MISPHVAPGQPQKQLVPRQLCSQSEFDVMLAAVVIVAVPPLELVAVSVDLFAVKGADVVSAFDAGEAD